MTPEPASRITRDRPDALYAPGDEVTFDIHLESEADDAHVCLSNDGYQVIVQQPLGLEGGRATVRGRLDEPGILRCRVNWGSGDKRQSMISAAAFDPYEIRPTATAPDDFDEFWREQKALLADVTPDPRLRPDPELGDARDYTFRKLTLASIEGTRVHGYLALPKGRPGPFPAILTLQNHGGGAWSVPREWATGFAEKGFISLAINTHDVDNGLGQAHYDRLNRGALASYTLRGFMDRDRYYFKSVHTGGTSLVVPLAGLGSFPPTSTTTAMTRMPRPQMATAR